MNKSQSLGALELDVLRFITDNGPITVGEAAAQFGEPKGYARTTIGTVMERLRQKAYLNRELKDGVNYYSSTEESSRLLSRLVGDFVKGTLGGQLTPLVAFLAEGQDLTPEEIAALRRIVEEADER